MQRLQETASCKLFNITSGDFIETMPPVCPARLPCLWPAPLVCLRLGGVALSPSPRGSPWRPSPWATTAERTRGHPRHPVPGLSGRLRRPGRPARQETGWKQGARCSQESPTCIPSWMSLRRSECCPNRAISWWPQSVCGTQARSPVRYQADAASSITGSEKSELDSLNSSVPS